jgi:hypothetical protein
MRKSNKLVLIIVGLLLIVAILFGFYHVKALQKAHSTFDNYYAFRGCKHLIKRTPTYGICTTQSGETIKIVLYHGKWYLDGDLPVGFWGHLN